MTAPWRVLHLVASSRGGGAAHVRDLALGLDPAHFAVQVAMPADGGQVGPADFGGRDIPFHQLDIASGLSPAAVHSVRRLSAGVDLLHLHGARAALFGRLAWGHTLLRPGLRLYRPAHRPRILYTIHGFAAPHYPPPRRAALLAIERLLLPLADRIVAVCRAERDAYLAAVAARPERLVVVHNGIDVAAFDRPDVDRAAVRAALGVPAAAALVTTVGRLDRPRDFDTLLAAFQSLLPAMPHAHLLVVGDGPQRPLVEQLITQRRLASRVTLAGWRRDLPAVYAASDLFTLTTWGWEGLPLTVLEAMAAAVPVVATRAGGIPEAVEDGRTGLLVERQDAAGLARALSSLLAGPAAAARLGQAGRARAHALFTVERMVAETAAVYEALLASSGRARTR